jgi:hypothetical protein
VALLRNCGSSDGGTELQEAAVLASLPGHESARPASMYGECPEAVLFKQCKNPIRAVEGAWREAQKPLKPKKSPLSRGSAAIVGGRLHAFSFRDWRRLCPHLDPFHNSDLPAPFRFLDELSHPAGMRVRSVEREPKIREQRVFQLQVRHIRPNLLPAAVINHALSFPRRPP